MTLFNFDNAKTKKGNHLGYSTAILYLAPSDMSGVVNVCKHATKECRELCLVYAGLAGIFPKINESRIKKTKWMNEFPEAFWGKVSREIQNHENLCYRNTKRLKRKLKPCVRLNGTSDIWNEHMQSIMYRFPDTQFYDYSKDFKRIVDWKMGKLPLNYHLTYSYGGGDAKNAIWCLENGVNVAFVFDVKRGDKLPSHHWGFEVVDGDTHDLRFLNQRDINKYGRIIGLRAKGKAVGVAGKQNGFVQSGSMEVQS
jgi:hypothetical protein